MRRAAGLGAVERELARARRLHTPLTVAFVDVDGLKTMNDTSGHAAGDALLTGVAALLRGRLRDHDIVFRYGGDEFVCVLPDADREAANRLFSRLSQVGAEKGCSFSYGLAAYQPGDSAVSLLGRADAELYESRARSRGWLQG
jgi:diguanylate cyclase (GGDEF)-like protein